MHYKHFIFLLVMLFFPTILVIGTDSDPTLPLIAAYRPDGHLYIFNLDENPIRVTDEPLDRLVRLYTGVYGHYNHVWSPDGTKLAFVAGGFNGSIGIFDTVDRQVWYLDVEANGGVPMSFSQDGEFLYYPSWGNPERDGVAGESYIVEYETGVPQSAEFNPVISNRIAVNPEAEYEMLEVIYYLPDMLGGSGGCFGDFVRMQEGLGHNFGAVLTENFHWATVFNPQSTIELPQGYGHSLNGEQTHFTYRTDTGIATFSIEDGRIITYETQVTPQLIAWHGEGESIFYSTLEEGEDLLWNRYDQNEDVFFSIYDCMFSSNTATITRLNPDTGEETVIYQNNHYAIASLMPDSSDDYLYFTAIPDAIPEWMEAMIAGECEEDNCEAFFYPHLYRLNLETGDVELILENVFKSVIAFPE